MKTPTFLLPALIFLLMGCHFDKEDLGPITTESWTVSDFDEIVLDTQGDIFLHKSSDFRVEVETHIELIPQIDLYQKDERLEIDLDLNRGEEKGLETLVYHVYAPFYTLIRTEDVCDVKSTDGWATNYLIVEISDVSDITLESLDVGTLLAKIKDVGNIRLSGYANEVEYRVEDVGNIFAFGLESEFADCKIEDVGNIEVFVNQELKAYIDGVGNIRYKGDPEIIVSDINITGEIINAN